MVLVTGKPSQHTNDVRNTPLHFQMCSYHHLPYIFLKRNAPGKKM
uniref:Uncharacterized protein n=1 Tax=Anguilla anguilla TaxID=7936 RepID=A0A0E9RCE1_ANGAN